MIDFSQNNAHLWDIVQSFPLYWILLGQAYRAYDRDVVNLDQPIYYKVEFPSDKNTILYARELNSRQQLLTYRVLIGGSDSGGEVDPLTIFNANTYFQTSKQSSAVITKAVTLQGEQQEVDYIEIYGSELSGSRSSGGISLDGFPRVYHAGHPPVYIEISTTESMLEQEYRLELKWVEA